MSTELTSTLPRLRTPPSIVRRDKNQYNIEDLSNSSPLRDNDPKERRRSKQQPVHFSIGQVVVVVTLGACLAGVLTAIVSVRLFSITIKEHTANAWNVPVMTRKLLQPLESITTSTPVLVDAPKENSRRPNIVWLMSFPNSGTSFTIHMTREVTNCTTATNYGLEGEIRDQPSVPAIQGSAGVHGPWLELIPNRTTRIADTILTKTHCKGFCSGSFCGPEKTFHTLRSFMIGCLTGNQGIQSGKDLRLIDTTYDKSLVTKAIHLFRHPLDNVVARFHLEYNENRAAGDKHYVRHFPQNADGFRRWCARDDGNRGLVQSHFVDRRLREFMLKIPCFNEFYRYTQWHNLAFATTQAMNLTTMILHYHEYSDNFDLALERLLNFLDLPHVGEGIVFTDGKVYRNYYTYEQKDAIRNFLHEFATAETWEQLKDYDFETDHIPLPTSIKVR